MAGRGALLVRGLASCGRPGVGREDSILTGEEWPGSGEKSMVEEAEEEREGAGVSERGEGGREA